MLTHEEIVKFKIMYRRVTGIPLSEGEAEKQGLQLINVIAILLELGDDTPPKPIKKTPGKRSSYIPTLYKELLPEWVKVAGSFKPKHHIRPFQEGDRLDIH